MSHANKIREYAVESGKTISGAITGGIIGLAIALYGRFQAQAAVRVRPGLDNVGFIEATVTNHGMDWLFYQYPNEMTVVLILLVGAIGAVIGAYK